jgi:hypothetical protein
MRFALKMRERGREGCKNTDDSGIQGPKEPQPGEGVSLTRRGCLTLA